MVGLDVYRLGFRLSWEESERQRCFAAQHVDSDAMLVDCCRGALVGDVRYNRCVVTGAH